ncbi:MAG: hypothetical protein ABR94_11440 [Sphingobacteriales bacterium BACL12 MAG-120802-bin5]|nr:MAG: hypothetical protein ABR94_11440 [Sphingobacteriales bacterium BACL12 MAG-120802-bin5]
MLEWDTNQPMTVQVTDMQGRNIALSTLQTDNRTLLDTRLLTPGMYFLSTPDGWKGQFIKQ